MKRRDFITLLGCTFVAGPAAAIAQDVKLRRIGFLRVGPPPAAFIDGFRIGLRELGFNEGQHFVIEYSFARSAAEMRDAAADLVRRKVEVIVASGTPSVLSAKEAAGPTPVVFVATLDPVATGMVASLARPGHNLTGMTSISGDVIAKRLQLIREVLPKLASIAILVRETSPTTPQYIQESASAAKSLGIELQVLSERNPKDLEEIFVAIHGSSALVVADDAEFTANRAEIAELALKHHVPTISGLRELAQAGALMAYGASFGELYRRAASQVHKILQGVSPGDIPVEQPTKFELVINLRTSKALGLDIPQSLLARADEVIE
jgi:ABC-type uncharacterized transport system substrate-binding protein